MRLILAFYTCSLITLVMVYLGGVAIMPWVIIPGLAIGLYLFRV